MCGIAGMIDLSGRRRQVSPGRLRAMAGAIIHRGPDEEGFLYEPGIGFANRRLSIVGLADGQQPVRSEDGRVQAVFNGEFFDYPELKAELQARGHVFRTHCDTELIPHLWEDHSDRLVDKLRGQFAFAVHDSRNDRVLIARDRFGICPLYWTIQEEDGGRWLLFGSEIKAILASGLVKAKPDLKGISSFFTFFGVPGPRTCFEGIQALRPGQVLDIHITAGREALVDRRSYFDLDFPDRGDEVRAPLPELVDRFEHVLLSAVKRRLRADVPVVSYLSGGVDSGIVVAMACKVLGRPIPSFTIRITDPNLDETERAMETANMLGCKPFVVDFGPSEALDTYPELIEAAESPVIDTSCAALLMLSRAVHQQGYKVALTGEGSDEWMAGYPWHKTFRVTSFIDRLTGLSFSTTIRDLFLGTSSGRQFPAGMARRVRDSIGGYNGWLDIYGLVGMSKLRLFSDNMLETAFAHNPFSDLELPLERFRKIHPLNRELYMSGRCHLPGLLLNAKGDRIAMRNSVEARYPFLDESVYRFLADIHPDYKFKGLREKHILREMAERWLPKNIARRRKAMFRAPFDSFHLESAPRYVSQLLSEESLKRTGYFDPKGLAAARAAYPTMRRNDPRRTSIEMGLAGLVSTQLWHHVYIDPVLCDLPGWTPPAIT